MEDLSRWNEMFKGVKHIRNMRSDRLTARAEMAKDMAEAMENANTLKAERERREMEERDRLEKQRLEKLLREKTEHEKLSGNE